MKRKEKNSREKEKLFCTASLILSTWLIDTRDVYTVGIHKRISPYNVGNYTFISRILYRNSRIWGIIVNNCCTLNVCDPPESRQHM